MRKMKKLLSAVLALAMMLSMIVLPVSAEEEREQFRMSDDKQFVLESGAQAHYYLSALLDGYGILYDSGNAPCSIRICDADGNSVKLYDWNEGSYVGYGFKIEEGKTYNIDISNNTGETVSYNVYMWLAESYGDLTMNQTAYAGNAQTTVNLTVSSETAMAFEPITWTSSDPDVAAIGTGSNMNRVIDLLAPGTATVTATTASGLTATCEVTVTAAEASAETIVPGDVKNFSLDANQMVFFNFVPEESGRYIVYVPANTCYLGVALGDDYVTGSEVRADVWEDDSGLFYGMAFDAQAGKNYVIKVASDVAYAMDCQLTLVNADALNPEEKPESIAVGEEKGFSLLPSAKLSVTFTVPEDGNYILSYDKSCYLHWSFLELGEMDGGQIYPEPWYHAEAQPYKGFVIPAKSNVTYRVDITNPEAVTTEGTLRITKAGNYESVAFNKTELSGYAGEFDFIDINLAPLFSYEEITWTSSNEDVAFPEALYPYHACVCFQAVGTATITATTASGLSATCEVTVKGQETIAPGETKNFTLEHNQQENFLFTPAESGRYIVYRPVSAGYYVDFYQGTDMDNATQVLTDNWQDSDFKYQGYAFDAEAGKTYLIRAVNWWNENPVDCQLSLMKAENYETFEIEWDVSGLVGSESWVSVSYGPENASEAVTWASSDETVVRIESAVGTDAQLKLVGAGTATVTATAAGGKKASCTVTVSEEFPMELNETVELTMKTGTTAYYNFAPAETGRYIFTMEAEQLVDVVVYDPDYGWISGDIWTNSDGTKEGYVFQMDAGIAYSIEICNGYDETRSPAITLVKAENYESIRFTQSSYSAYLGSYLTLSLIGSPEYADEAITWKSSNSDVAYIEYASGSEADVILLNAGTATVTATTASGKTATCTVTAKAPISLKNNAEQKITLGMDEIVVFSFTAPSAGTYSICIAGSGCGVAIMDEATGEWPESTGWWYANGASGNDFAMTADQTFLIALYGANEEPTEYTVCAGQATSKVSGLKLSADAATTYRGVPLYLETWFEPILSKGESVVWTSNNPKVASYSETVTEYGYSYHIINASAAGTATLIATSKSGYQDSCAVTVLEPEDISTGKTTKELAEFDYVVYNFIPEITGSYRLYWGNSDTTSLMIWDEANTLELTNWEDEAYTGYEMELIAGQEYFIVVQSEIERVQTVSFYLEELAHEHRLTYVAEKAATFTEDGNRAYYVCACGAMFTDEAGTAEVTEADLLIPKLIQVDGSKAEIDKEAIDEAAAQVGQGGEVSIPVADVSENVKSAALPVESLTQIAEKEATLTVEMPTATVTMDTAVLAAVVEKAGENATVTLEVTEVAEEDLTESQMAAIEQLEKKPAMTISAELLVDGQSIASKENGGFGENAKVTVKIPVGSGATDYTVLYIADDGTVEVIPAVYENGFLILELEHFSDYAIIKNTVPGDVNDDGLINVVDLMYLANHFAKGETINKANADVNADGTVDVRDLMYLANFFAGKETTLG